MDNNTLESQWTQYATSKASSKNNRAGTSPLAVGGMLAATSAAILYSFPSQANASFVTFPGPSGTFNKGTQSRNFTLAAGALLSTPGIQFKGYGGVGLYGGVQAIKGLLVTNGNLATHGVKNFAFGANITAGANFKHASSQAGPFGAPLHVQSPGGALVSGTVPVNQNAFLGFKINNGPHAGDLGYIELSIGNDGLGNNPLTPDSLTIVKFGFDTTPGATVTAGELPPAAPVPEASNTATALLLLACAGGSLTSWRRRKQAAA